MTLALAQQVPPLDPSNWARDFVPFSLFHLITVAACFAVMAAASILGRLWLHTPKETRLRTAWGVAVLLYQLYVTVHWFLPANINWARSLPLMLCDLAAFVAGFAMLRPDNRWALTLLYFWGIGLSTQAFFTPVLQYGYEYGAYWRFWIGHVAIVGSAIYAVAVLAYRPGLRDLILAALVTIAYGIVVLIVNLTIDAMHLLPAGERANYGYIGNTTPKNPTVMDKLGPWPARVFVVSFIVLIVFTLLWSVWQRGKMLLISLAGVVASAGGIVLAVVVLNAGARPASGAASPALARPAAQPAPTPPAPSQAEAPADAPAGQ